MVAHPGSTKPGRSREAKKAKKADPPDNSERPALGGASTEPLLQKTLGTVSEITARHNLTRPRPADTPRRHPPSSRNKRIGRTNWLTERFGRSHSSRHWCKPCNRKGNRHLGRRRNRHRHYRSNRQHIRPERSPPDRQSRSLETTCR